MAKTPASRSFPPLPALQWDGFSWSGTDLFPSWAGFQSRLGPYASVNKKKPSKGEAKVSVCAPGGGGDAPAEKADPDTSQVKAYQCLKEHEEAVARSVRKAIFDLYTQKLCAEYREAGVEEEFAPEIGSPDELRTLIGLTTVHVLGIAKSKVAYIGFEFGCTWDDEHGIGVMTHKERIVEVGGADCSFLGWIAEKDAH